MWCTAGSQSVFGSQSSHTEAAPLKRLPVRSNVMKRKSWSRQRFAAGITKSETLKPSIVLIAASPNSMVL